MPMAGPLTAAMSGLGKSINADTSAITLCSSMHVSKLDKIRRVLVLDDEAYIDRVLGRDGFGLIAFEIAKVISANHYVIIHL